MAAIQPSFSRDNLKGLHIAFHKAAKSGSLDKAGFAHVLSEIIPGNNSLIPDPAHATQLQQLFEVFDKDSNGSVDFNEFASGLSTLLEGSERDKVIFAFRLLDVNGDGTITLSETLNYFKSYLFSRARMANSRVAPERWKLIEEHLKRGFIAADTDKSGTISLAEFENATRDPDHVFSVVFDHLKIV